MVAIIFADLSVTLNIKHASVEGNATLRSVIDGLTDVWDLDDITVRSRPVTEDELNYEVESFAKVNQRTGDLVLEIEKH